MWLTSCGRVPNNVRWISDPRRSYDLPMGTREQAQFEERWQAFQRLDRMRNHWWWRPGWRVGRSFYTWHLTFGDAPQVHELVRQVQAELDLATLDQVPIEGLHLTMQGVGFTDEVDRNDIGRIVEATRSRLGQLRPFKVTLGPVDPDAEGVGLLISPWDDVERVRSAARDAIASVWGSANVPDPASSFRPHVTVAYSGADVTAGELRERITPLRDLPLASVDISRADLIELNRDDKLYRWTVVASVPLG